MPTPPHSASVSPPCRRRSSPPAPVWPCSPAGGGVHRGAAESGDVSHDLLAIARHPVVTVSAGAKAFLDLPPRGVRDARRSGRRLEHRTVPGLLHPRLQLTRHDDRPFRRRRCGAGGRRAELGHPGGVLVANPIPETDELDPDRINTAIAAARRAQATEVQAPATPVVLAAIAAATDGECPGESALAENNARRRRDRRCDGGSFVTKSANGFGCSSRRCPDCGLVRLDQRRRRPSPRPHRCRRPMGRDPRHRRCRRSSTSAATPTCGVRSVRAIPRCALRL